MKRNQIKFLFSLIVLVGISISQIIGQSVQLKAYAFEENNRGYLNETTIVAKVNGEEVGKAVTDREGYASFSLPIDADVALFADKKGFKTKIIDLSTKGKTPDEFVYAKFEMTRLPGYILEGTVAELTNTFPADAIDSVLIEVYNHTAQREVAVFEPNHKHTFSVPLHQGNKYIIMLRKPGYFTKRITANINIDGCILCFEGVGSITPGVTDNLTAGFENGTLGANIQMKKIEMNRSVRIDNILYDYNKWDIRPDAAKELDKLAAILKDNPQLSIELGSHTDSRGGDDYNLQLSKKRAQSAVNYIYEKGIIADRIAAKGYGESQLVNNCKNGVECSDRDHERNRRTVFSVTGIMDDRLDERPLREIMMDELVMSGGFGEGGVFVMPAGGIPPSNDMVPTEAEIPSMQNVGTEKIDIQGGSKIDTEEEVTIIKPKEEGEVRDWVRKKTEKETEMPPLEQEKGAFGEKESEVNSPKTAKQSIEKKSDPKTYYIKPKPVSKSFTGFKVELLNAASELDLDNDLFQQFGNIKIEEADGGFSYLVGEFKNSKSAQRYLENILIDRYPKAQVVYFKNGKRNSFN